jgi:hypothetical protein
VDHGRGGWRMIESNQTYMISLMNIIIEKQSNLCAILILVVYSVLHLIFLQIKIAKLITSIFVLTNEEIRNLSLSKTC